jgi:hypothetical protein
MFVHFEKSASALWGNNHFVNCSSGIAPLSPLGMLALRKISLLQVVLASYAILLGIRRRVTGC